MWNRTAAPRGHARRRRVLPIVAQPAVADDMGTPFSGLSFSGLEPGGGP
jgi:hypothetical protein